MTPVIYTEESHCVAVWWECLLHGSAVEILDLSAKGIWNISAIYGQCFLLWRWITTLTFSYRKIILYKRVTISNQDLIAIKVALARHGNIKNKLKIFDLLCIAWIVPKNVTVPMAVWLMKEIWFWPLNDKQNMAVSSWIENCSPVKFCL